MYIDTLRPTNRHILTTSARISTHIHINTCVGTYIIYIIYAYKMRVLTPTIFTLIVSCIRSIVAKSTRT